MLLSRAQELSPSSRFSPFHHHINNIHKIKPFLIPTISPSFSISSPMHAHTSLFSPLTLSHNSHCLHLRRRSVLTPSPLKTPQNLLPIGNPKCLSTFAEHLACETQASGSGSGSGNDADPYELEEKGAGASVAQGDLKHLKSPGVEVKELEELPEEWRRTKLAWLCKELPGQKAATLVRLLKAQKKWMRQEDATYLVVHCLRVRANEAGFRVYKWMVQQHWYRFDFALATKVADHMGKEGKFVKCRDIFDDIINKNRVPSESTFHILVVAYLSANVEGCLEESCGIYNRMIQLGGYRPQLSLHNSLFRALVSKPGSVSKLYLKQAEFIYHNLVTSGLEVQKDIYNGLIWLHSYQDTVDKDRIMSLREEMKQAGIEEGREVLVSILRACSNESNVEEAERTWLKLLECDGNFPPQAFVYKMEVYAKVGQPMMSLETFREMQERFRSATPAAYHKIIEVFCRAQQMELAESLMREFSESGLKPLMLTIIHMMNMYFSLSLHDKVQSMFSESLEKCPPNRMMYNIYLDSLVRVGNLDKAEEIFNHMYTSTAIGVNARSCNTILSGYFSSEDHKKAEKIYDLMCHKKFGIDSSLMEKLDLTLSRKEGKEPINSTLSKEQREILVGLLLGGLQIESDEDRKKHMVQFEFNENCAVHFVLRKHLYDLYREWLHPSCMDKDDVPFRFCTISHSYFGFYFEQFWPDGQPAIPKLIHRWLSPQVLAYWFMYGGHRTSSGDILLKLKGSREGVGKVVKTFKARSLNCRVKRKGKVYWIGFLGSDSAWFWKLVEPYVLHDLKESLKAASQISENDLAETQGINFDNGSDFDEEASEYSDIDSI